MHEISFKKKIQNEELGSSGILLLLMDTSDNFTTKLTCAEQDQINHQVDRAAVANRSHTLLEVNVYQNVNTILHISLRIATIFSITTHSS